MDVNQQRQCKSPYKTHMKDEQIRKKNERFMKIMIICKHIKKIIHHIKCTHEMKQKYEVECGKYIITKAKHKYRHIHKHTSKIKVMREKISKKGKNGNEKIIVDGCFYVNNFCFMR